MLAVIVMQTLVHDNPRKGFKQAKDLVDEALSIAQNSLRCGVHTTLGNSSRSLVFNRDIFLNIPRIAN